MASFLHGTKRCSFTNWVAVLQDSHGRAIDYLRVSVTDRCDLRCGYCMPKGFRDFEEPCYWLTFDELLRAIGAFAPIKINMVVERGVNERGFSR